MASEKAELLTEALAAIIDLVPELDRNDYAYIAKVHPWATDSFLSGLLAMSEGELTDDTRLIGQLMQQLQAQQATIVTLETNFGNAVVDADVPTPPPAAWQQQQRSQKPSDEAVWQQQQQQPRPGSRAADPASPLAQRPLAQRPSGSPLPQSEAPRKPGPADRPPKADPKVRPASPRADDRPPGKHPQPKQKQQQQAPSYDEYPEENISTQVSPVPKRPVPKTKPKPKSKGRDPEDDGDGTIPWSEFAEDGEGGTVQPADAAEEEEMARRRNAREEIRFYSISEELKAINAGLIDPSEISTVSAVDTRQACQHCGRKFLPDRLGRHIKVCEDLKRGKEWRGTWKSPHKSDLDSQKSLLTSSFKV
jgi:hypothetical protein